MNDPNFDSSDEHVFRPQNQFGIAYRDDGFVSFQAQVLELKTVVSNYD